MVNAFSGSNRPKEGGRLVVYKQDFLAHSQGNTLRHSAEQIDMNPVLANTGGATTVQEVLSNLSTTIAEIGGGFITVGLFDGYDTEGRADFLVGSPETLSLHLALEAAFAHSRLQNGGIILIKAGTYRLTSKVSVPAGICILGEAGGTIISGASPLSMFEVLNTLPNGETVQPYDLGFWQGLFQNKSLTAPQVTRFINLILSDNYDGYFDPGTDPSIPNTSSIGNPAIIQINAGTNVICEQVSFLGKVSTTQNPAVVTRRAIDYKGFSGNPTALQVNNCYFDSFESCISFTPSSGTSDFLSINGCRMRYLGKQSGGTTETNCAVSFNLCNASINNNYFLGDKTFGASGPIVLRNFTSPYPSTLSDTNDSPKIVITGNTGGLTSGTTSDRFTKFFIDNSSAQNYRSVISGNNWGLTSDNNNWVITCGDGVSSYGDIVGPKAVDVALELASISSGMDATILINQGTYTVTRGGTTTQRIKLIGNIKGSTRPILNLSSSSTDLISRPTINVGLEVRNLKIISNSLFQTLTVLKHDSSDIKHAIVDNCVFEDSGLIFDVVGNTSLSSAESIMHVSKCRFSQSVGKNNVSLLAPASSSAVLISDSNFIGGSYAIGIGSASGSGYTSSNNGDYQNIIFERCYFKLSGSSATITAASPITGKNNYIWVDNLNAKFTMRDCQLDSMDLATFASTAPIDSSLLAGAMTKFIDIKSDEITIENCTILGPDQTYTVILAFALPTLYLQPRHSVRVYNSEIRGSLPVQICSTNMADVASDPTNGNLFDKSGVFVDISNSSLLGYAVSSANKCTTVLDFDFNNYVFLGADQNYLIPSISIENSQFGNIITNSDLFIAAHTTIDSNYDAAGLIQIYAPGWSVKFNNNTIHSFMPSGSVGLSSLNMAGIIISTEPNSLSPDHSSIIMTGNHIKFNCDGTGSANGTKFSCVDLRSACMSINNNYLQYYTTTGSQTANKYRPYMRIRQGSASLLGGAVISGNTFNRIGALSLAAIIIDSVSGVSGQNPGLFTNNVFASSTLDGADTDLILDNSENPWSFTNNIGLEETVKVLPAHCNFQINEEIGLDFVNGILQLSPTLPNLFSVTFSGAPTAQSLENFIDLQSLIPYGTRITSISLDAVVSAVFSGGPSLNLLAMQYLTDDTNFSATATASTNLTSLGTHSLTLTFDPTLGSTSTAYMKPEFNPRLYLACSFQGVAVGAVTVRNFVITYQ